MREGIRCLLVKLFQQLIVCKNGIEPDSVFHYTRWNDLAPLSHEWSRYLEVCIKVITHALCGIFDDTLLLSDPNSICANLLLVVLDNAVQWHDVVLHDINRNCPGCVSVHAGHHYEL